MGGSIHNPAYKVPPVTLTVVYFMIWWTTRKSVRKGVPSRAQNFEFEAQRSTATRPQGFTAIDHNLNLQGELFSPGAVGILRASAAGTPSIVFEALADSGHITGDKGTLEVYQTMLMTLSKIHLCQTKVVSL